MVNSREISVLLGLFLMLFSLSPIFATTDLTAYTTAGNYVTPAYGNFLGGDYWYYKDGVKWVVYGDTYENIGVYKIYRSSIDDTYIQATGKINAPVAGNIYLCAFNINDSDSGYPANCKFIASYSSPSSDFTFQSVNEYELDSSVLISGKINFYFELRTSGGGYYDSKIYEAWYNVEDAFSNKREIIITSANNLSDGVITITLNNTNFTDNLNGSIFYDNDGQEQTLSGTLSDLVFTDTAGTRAYPYYIDSYTGGFYNVSRYNASVNTTIIKIFIDEDVTSKAIYMFYNPKNPGNWTDARQGWFNQSDKAYDSNNNPFVIHQLYLDYRWNQSYTNNLFNVSGGLTTYSRYSYIGTPSSFCCLGNYAHLHPFKNNMTHSEISTDTRNNIFRYENESYFYVWTANPVANARFYNSSQSYLGGLHYSLSNVSIYSGYLWLNGNNISESPL